MTGTEILKAVETINKEVFEERAINQKEYYHDITCFNEIATRCVSVYDNAQLGKTYIIIGLTYCAIRNIWVVEYFKRVCGIDGIDIMNDANTYLKNGRI